MKNALLRKTIKQVLHTSSSIAIIGNLLLFLCLYDPTADIFSIRSSIVFSFLISAFSGVFCFYLLFLLLLKRNIPSQDLQKIIRHSRYSRSKSIGDTFQHSSPITAPLHRGNDWYNNPGNPASPSYFGRFTKHSRNY